ncbi:MAG TPA: membrane protein insertion efficiency factor YidD [Planctomycetaceae bacterium]|nr:membrane protein insertion efficiency factor YidD [Planctomycetaceae bacterium]HQZ65029.1 membrane protein insertion efficiency factor YidD [Planctomycetaceae bacterium]HRA88204.1 membrane protein insertion efficiency factor YidD [Planctomycetaceae bacterium]
MSNAVDEDPSIEETADADKVAVEAESGGWRRIFFLPAATAIVLVRCYQIVLSPVLGRTCRFHPSCSQYYILAVRKYGLFSGTWKGIRRIARCHPWNPGGYDPP